jgi:SAM-dependent methyltransferase
MSGVPLQFREGRPPLPSDDLILRVVQSFGTEQAAEVREQFDRSAIEHLRQFERGLAAVGREFAQFERLLDFGCGCGRFVRHLGPLAEEGTEIHGIDIDGEMIDWLRENVAYGEFVHGPHEPPAPYADGFFDLVINHSVFTHLDEQYQDLWLAELQRIVRPGGLLMLTVQSLTTWNTALRDIAGGGDDPEPYRERLESDGILFIADDAFVGSTHPAFYHTTFHAPWYVFEHWTRFFDLRAYLPHGSHSQDLVILERRPEGVEAPKPIGHRTGGARGTAPDAPPAPSPGPRLRGRVATLAAAAVRRVGGGEDRHEVLAAEVARLAEAVRGRERELMMLRQGLYEQARRISLVAAELREELARLRRDDS